MSSRTTAIVAFYLMCRIHLTRARFDQEVTDIVRMIALEQLMEPKEPRSSPCSWGDAPSTTRRTRESADTRHETLGLHAYLVSAYRSYTNKPDKTSHVLEVT